MKQVTFVRCVVVGALLVGLVARWPATVSSSQAEIGRSEVPNFQYDPTWPKPLPNNWIIGNIAGMAIDSKDHIWVVQRPGSTTGLSERAGLAGEGECCFPAPPVLEFDQAGNVVQAWGPIHEPDGTLIGPQKWGRYPNVDWPKSEHGIFVDDKDHVWVGNNAPPSQVLKFTRDGKFLARIGQGEATSSNDTMNLAGPAGLLVDPKTNELYVADGYRNRRMIVFDADTGAYKRHWGAYGKRPPDGPLGGNPIEGKYDANVRSQQFATVHCVAQSKDGLLYVCDRVNNRIQVFKTDGTFVKEGVVAPQSRSFGAVHALAFSSDKDQRFVYVADGVNKKVWILQRDQMKIIGSIGSGGRDGGQLLVVHALAVDSDGNIYAGETNNGNRVQRFKYQRVR